MVRRHDSGAAGLGVRLKHIGNEVSSQHLIRGQYIYSHLDFRYPNLQMDERWAAKGAQADLLYAGYEVP